MECLGTCPAPLRPRRGLVPSLARHAFSFEVAFALFLCAGAYKSSPRLSWCPVDITILTALASFSIGVWLVLRRRIAIARASSAVPVLMLSLGGWMAASLLWAPPRAEGGYKVAYMLTMTLWSLVGAALVAQDRARVSRRLGVFVAVAFWFAFELLIFGHDAEREGVAATLGSWYLGYGVVIGVGAVALSSLSLLAPWPLPVRATGLAGVIPLVLALLDSGGRGPLIGLGPALCLVPLCGTLVAGHRDGRLRLRTAGLVSALLIALAGAASIGALVSHGGVTDLQTVQRLQSLRTDPTLGARLPLFRAGLALWAEHPIVGGGAGAFLAATGSEYPHNALIEALSEYGVVGGGLYLAMVSAALMRLACAPGLWRDHLRITALALIVYMLLQAMKSSDLGGYRVLYAMLGLSTMVLPAECPCEKRVRLGR